MTKDPCTEGHSDSEMGARGQMHRRPLESQESEHSSASTPDCMNKVLLNKFSKTRPAAQFLSNVD